jgi:hypothetical protein
MRIRIFTALMLLVGVSFPLSSLFSENNDDAAGDDVVINSEVPPDASQTFREEKAKLLQTLKAEVEPNLVKGDIDKLQRNVMRLGSYRKDWVQKSQNTLLANPALSELYIYRYATVKNPRLNHALLETLLMFTNFRFPRAALAFADDLARTTEDKERILNLFVKVVQQDQNLTQDVFQLVASDWGKDIPTEQKLYFAERICNRLANLPALSQSRAPLDQWIGSAGNLWEKVVAAEVQSCLRGG